VKRGDRDRRASAQDVATKMGERHKLRSSRLLDLIHIGGKRLSGIAQKRANLSIDVYL